MKKLLRGFLIFGFTLGLNQLFAQKPFATIRKNVNSRASDLGHKLNASKDTLLLNSEKKIDYVYTINREYQREIDQRINANDYKVPLAQLSKGKHVIVVGQSRMRIVFVVWVNEDASLPVESKTLVSSGNN